MSTTGSIRVEAREKSGGGTSRALRRSGFIPGVIYGGKEENVLLQIDPRDIDKGLDNPAFYTTIFDLKVNGKKENALVKKVQFHPVTDRPLHVDFYRVSKDTKVHVHIPITFVNEEESPGIKRGGVLNIVLHSLEVTCAANKIPENITIDLTGLEIGDSVHTESIALPDGVAPTHPERDNTLATIVAPTLKVESEEAEEAEGEEAAEGDKNKSKEEKSDEGEKSE